MIQDRFNQSMDNLIFEAAFKKVALSISGGIDSIALLHLFSKWAIKHQIKATIFSVNHGLRPESNDEIKFVEHLAHKLGHEFYALTWQHDITNKSALQERARNARYKLMTDKCHQLGISTLLTAHHKDDMLENYIMRFRKKSSIFGLSYSPTHFNNDVQILRPLLIFEKKELKYYVQENNIKWREDSSNLSDLYERNRVRKEISNYSSDKKSKLFEDMFRCNEQAQSLNKLLLNVIAESVLFSKYGFALINIEKIKIHNNDIKIQILNHVLTIVSGQNNIPRFRSINKILLLVNHNSIINHSLHGCILKTIDYNILIFREKSQINNKLVKTHSGLLWDNRFSLNCENLESDYKIETLNIAEYKQLKKEFILNDLVKIVGNNHKSILFTLPVVKNLEKIIAIPHIYYYDKVNFKDTLQVSFKPSFVSRFTHFL